jgi:hypothetical protein
MVLATYSGVACPALRMFSRRFCSIAIFLSAHSLSRIGLSCSIKYAAGDGEAALGIT